MSTLSSIPSGPYLGFSLPELRAELERYKAEVKQSGTRLLASNGNGHSYQFGAREGTLEEWSANLQVALNYLDPDAFPVAPATDRSAVRFT